MDFNQTNNNDGSVNNAVSPNGDVTQTVHSPKPPGRPPLDWSRWEAMFEWGWTVEWLGWRRCLWLAVQADFLNRSFGGVFLGLMVCYGKRVRYDMKVHART